MAARMLYTVDQLRAVARSGGGMTLDAAAYTQAQLTGICRDAALGSAPITLRNVTQMTSRDLETLASIAPGLIVFDFTRGA
jgi:hypothetical protein